MSYSDCLLSLLLLVVVVVVVVVVTLPQQPVYSHAAAKTHCGIMLVTITDTLRGVLLV